MCLIGHSSINGNIMEDFPADDRRVPVCTGDRWPGDGAINLEEFAKLVSLSSVYKQCEAPVR